MSWSNTGDAILVAENAEVCSPHATMAVTMSATLHHVQWTNA